MGELDRANLRVWAHGQYEPSGATVVSIVLTVACGKNTRVVLVSPRMSIPLTPDTIVGKLGSNPPWKTLRPPHDRSTLSPTFDWLLEVLHRACWSVR